MIFSNVHLAYGDDSVYQQLVGVSQHVEDGDTFSDWEGCGTKLRAVKCAFNSYVAIVRDDDGILLYEGGTYEFPMNALLDAKDWYRRNIENWGKK